MVNNDNQKNYVLISADTHAGASIPDYKPYLESALHDDFDRWAATFHDRWSEHDVEEVDPNDAHDGDLHLGVASFLSPYNWESDKRLAHLEGEGIAAEVIFPNTVPPFYPTGVITASAPTNDEEYRYRWAGIKAHNRWLADFCDLAPGRRAGMAQVFLYDIDDAVEEVKWAKEHGLAGVLIPGDHHRQLINLFPLTLDPFWAACSEMEMAVHQHTVAVADPETPETGPAAPAIGVKESHLFISRSLPHLMIGGVFHRHPNLKFVVTEATVAWAVPMLANLDDYFREAVTKGSMMYTFGHRAVEGQDMLPSEYARRNLYFGGFMTPDDVAAREVLGVDNLMWGADYPHHEGTYPFTAVAIRLNFSDVPVAHARRMLGENAASVYGLDLDYLQTFADRFGPTVEAVAKPVTGDEIPRGTVCPTFAASAGLFN